MCVSIQTPTEEHVEINFLFFSVCTVKSQVPMTEFAEKQVAAAFSINKHPNTAVQKRKQLSEHRGNTSLHCACMSVLNERSVPDTVTGWVQ